MFCYFTSLPRFKVQGGHEYEAKIRHEEAKQKHREQTRLAAATAGGRWSAPGRGNIRLTPGRILGGRGRGESGTLGGAKKYKITKAGTTNKNAVLGNNTTASLKRASTTAAEAPAASVKTPPQSSPPKEKGNL